MNHGNDFTLGHAQSPQRNLMFYKNYKSNAWFQGRNIVIGIEIIGEETKNYRKQQQ